MKVKATREGLIGQKTSSGYVIDPYVSFVALPSVHALHKFILLSNPANGYSTYAEVLDVGPHYTDDDGYVFHGDRPKAETQIVNGKPGNGAGIDLSDRVWKSLGMTDNTEVEWEFVI